MKVFSNPFCSLCQAFGRCRSPSPR